MRRIRVIPVLLLDQNKLVKTVRFGKSVYVGDPINAVKIFNEKEVDELAVLDISATVRQQDPPYSKIEELAGECFMPLSYGGGIRQIDQIKKIFDIGVEKVIINSAIISNPLIVSQAAKQYGSQSIVVSIDVKKNLWGKSLSYIQSGKKISGFTPVQAALWAEENGAGELLLNSIDNDGAYVGYNLEIIKLVSRAVNIPVIACGGARNIDDFAPAVNHGASAIAAGSMFVFHGPHKAVLISFPSPSDLAGKFYNKISIN